MLALLLYCLGNVFAVEVFGELSLIFSVVLTSVGLWFFSVSKKIKACHLFRNICVYCLALPIRLVMQGKLAGLFFCQQTSSPFIISCTLPVFFAAQVLGKSRDVLSILLWNKGHMTCLPEPSTFTLYFAPFLHLRKGSRWLCFAPNIKKTFVIPTVAAPPTATPWDLLLTSLWALPHCQAAFPLQL